MVWQVDLSGKCIVVTGGNRVRSHLPSLRIHIAADEAKGYWSCDKPSMRSRYSVSSGLIQWTDEGTAGAHVAIIYQKSPDAPEVAKSIAEKYDVRCVVSPPHQLHSLLVTSFPAEK